MQNAGRGEFDYSLQYVRSKRGEHEGYSTIDYQVQ